MRHVYSLEEAQLTKPTVVMIGVFDGVHRGHQHLIHEAVYYAAQHGLSPVVLTFFPHPQMVIRGLQPGFYLMLPEQKAAKLGELGVDLVVTHPFDDKVRHMRAVEFVDRLLNLLNMQALWVGADFAMGYQREGNIEFLRTQSAERGFNLRVIDLMDAEGDRVSSTRIREAIKAGDVEEAARLLGHLYALPGLVVEGNKRGRTIGIPTANLAPSEEQVIPARGVYAAWAVVGLERHPCVVNIGLRPTFDGSGILTIEAHLLDYSGDLYGKTIILEFASRLREEMKFPGVESLIAQISADIQQARGLLEVP